MTVICRLAFLVLVLALVPASARAATPVLLGPGTQPGVAVDSAGTAYIAWIGTEPSVTTLHFCRLPRNATSCQLTQTLTVDGTSLTRPFLTVHGSTVRIYTYRYGLTSGPRFSSILMLTSIDGGASFDPGVPVGTPAFDDAIEGPGNTVSFIADNSSVFQNTPADGSAMTTTEAHLADDHPYNPSIALHGGTIVAVMAAGSGAAQFRLHAGGAGDPNDPATWTPAQDFSTYAGYMRLADGPTGTFLASDNAAGSIVVQHFGGTSFDAPVTVPGPAHELSGGSKDFAQDPSGRLHLVWPLGDADGTHIGYATSDDGSAWQTTRLEAGPAPNDLAQGPGAMRLALAGDHLGVTVWADSASPRNVHAMAIGPVATPAPALGKTANAATVKGTVRVKLKGKRGFVTLEAGEQVPLGSTFDTTEGTVAIDTSAGAGKPLQHGEFNGGLFTVKQASKNPLTTLSMTGGGLDKCGRPVPSGGAAKARKRSRTLFGNVTKGSHYRSRGRNSAATVRGTKWTMTDSCKGTLTTVKQGTVVVRDFTLRKNKTLRTGQHYLARPPHRVQRRGNR